MLTTENVAAYVAAVTPPPGVAVHPTLAAFVLHLATERTCRESGKVFVPADQWDGFVIEARELLSTLPPLPAVPVIAAPPYLASDLLRAALPSDGTATYPREQVEAARNLVALDDPDLDPPRTEAVKPPPRHCDSCGNKLHPRTKAGETVCKPCQARATALMTGAVQPPGRGKRVLVPPAEPTTEPTTEAPPPDYRGPQVPYEIPVVCEKPPDAKTVGVTPPPPAAPPPMSLKLLDLNPDHPLAREIEAGKREFNGQPFDIHGWVEPQSKEEVFVAVLAGTRAEGGFVPLHRHTKRPHGWVYQKMTANGRAEP